MTYKPYLNVDEYTGDIPSAKLEKQLLQASRHIDVLTYNRIVGNFDKLTEFQKEIIKEVCKNLFSCTNKKSHRKLLKRQVLFE